MSRHQAAILGRAAHASPAVVLVWCPVIPGRRDSGEPGIHNHKRLGTEH